MNVIWLQKGDACSPTENGHNGSEDEAEASEDEDDGLVDVEDLGQVVASKVREVLFPWMCSF